MVLGIETDLVAPVPAAALLAREAAAERYLRQGLAISTAGRRCPATGYRLDLTHLPDEVLLHLAFDCAQRPAHLLLDYLLFFDIDPGHRVLGVLTDGDTQQEFLLDATLPSAEFDLARAPGHAARLRHAFELMWLGAQHMLQGLDHLLFLITLVLLPTRFVRLVQIVTAFTLAHSLTLAAAWFGWLSVSGRWIEVAIALSIAYVALENLLVADAPWRWLVSLGFGLVHGLGLYAALDQLALERLGMVTTLLSFNLGVELAQLAVVAAVYPLMVLARRRGIGASLTRYGSVAVLVIALWWTMERLLAA